MCQYRYKNVTKMLQKVLTFDLKYNILICRNSKKMEEWTLAIGDIIVGVDIGTERVTTVVGEVNNFNQIEIICSTSSRCSGLKKAKIIDEDEITTAIGKTIKQAEEQASLKINSAYTTIPGQYVTIVQNSVLKEIKDKYAGISVKDVAAAITQVKDIEIPEDKVLIDIAPSEFILESGEKVDDPVGNLSASFTLNGQVILADKEYVTKLRAIFRKLGIEVDGIVPNILAQRNVILDTNELSDNVVILDVGAGSTNIGAFEGKKFINTNTIPIGGENITQDIAFILNITREEADNLKKQYGLALKSFIDNDNDIILNTCADSNNKSKSIKSSELIEIIEARIEEIFTLVNKDITSQGFKPRINSVIITGQGIATINKSDVAGKIILNIPVKIATGRLISTIKPEYRASYALIRYVAARPFAKTVSSSIDVKSDESILKTILQRVKDFFYS